MKTRLSRLKWPIGLIVIGVGVTASAAISLYFSFADPGISILVPGETTFAITTPGNYTLWSEVSGSFDGTLMTFPTGLPAGVMIKILNKTDGTVVPLQSKWPTTRTDSGGVIRLAIGTVRFDNAGPYQIATEGLQEKRALHLDRLEVNKVFLAGLLFFASAPLIVAGLAWGLFIVLSSRGIQPNQTIQATGGRSDA
ncbi:MAG: hypothetical protein QOE26_3017 [Verrucomicrobiota bacterium]